MDYEKMENNVKEFVLKQLDLAKTYPQYNFSYRGVAYGAIQFACNYCFPRWNDDLALWWDDIAKEFA
jgi:hypothetical protein